MVRASASQLGDRGSNPGQVIPKTLKNSTYCLLVWCLTLWECSREVEHAELPVDKLTPVAITAIADVWPRVQDCGAGAGGLLLT